MGDVVRRINSSNFSIGSGAAAEQVSASIDSSGVINIRSQAAAGGAGTLNFKIRFSPTLATTDLNTNLGFATMPGGTATTTSFGTSPFSPVPTRSPRRA